MLVMKTIYRKRAVLLSLGIIMSILVSGQDMVHTQYFNAPLDYNPANTGLTKGLYARFLFRDQWPSLPVDLKSYYFSADIGDRNLPGAGGLGLVILSDNPGYGLINTLNIGLTFSVNVPLSSFSTIQIGIKGAMIQKKINWNELTFSDELDKRYGEVYKTDFITDDPGKKLTADFGVGGVLQMATETGTFHGTLGLGIDHLFSPDISFFATENTKLPRKWTTHADFIMTQPDRNRDPLKFDIGFLYQNQDKVNNIQAGITLFKYGFYLGGWYRSIINGPSPNTIIAINAGYRYMFNEEFGVRFMYSYDIQMSNAMMGTGGAHEVSLMLELPTLSIFGNGGRGGGSYIIPSRSRSYITPLECSPF